VQAIAVRKTNRRYKIWLERAIQSYIHRRAIGAVRA
jgi:hypothetical protein